MNFKNYLIASVVLTAFLAAAAFAGGLLEIPNVPAVVRMHGNWFWMSLPKDNSVVTFLL